jgi:hypothetical protein
MVRLASLFLLLTLFDAPHALAKSFVLYVATAISLEWNWGYQEAPCRMGFKPIDLSEVGVRRKFRKQVHDTD